MEDYHDDHEDEMKMMMMMRRKMRIGVWIFWSSLFKMCLRKSRGKRGRLFDLFCLSLYPPNCWVFCQWIDNAGIFVGFEGIP
ncbi:hypothetical protein CsSME_00047929 [Camellia sinensis var. sinensis]